LYQLLLNIGIIRENPWFSYSGGGVVDVFVARQPILARNQKVFGYELLCRSGTVNSYLEPDGEKASLDVLRAFNDIGLDNLTNGKRAFVNFTKSLLNSDIPTVMPKDLIVIEILEDVEPDQQIVETCMRLKKLGYMLAMDDFVYKEELRPLIQLADIIKVDFLQTRAEERREIIERIGRPQIKLLAEKVESKEDFEHALQLGYSYFQGYYFCKPTIITGKSIVPFKANLLRLLQLLSRPNVSIDALERGIMIDVSLTYNLLKFLKSAAFGFRSEIRTIRQAIIMLGAQEIRKWTTLMSLKSLGQDKPDELLLTATCRALFCEQFATQIGLQNYKTDLFLLGLFSLIDVFLDKPLSEATSSLPLSTMTKDALHGKDNKYRSILNLIIALENAQWDTFFRGAAKNQWNLDNVMKSYYAAIIEAEKIFDE